MITIKEYTEQLETENRTLYEDKNYWKRLAEKRKFQLQQKENIIKEVREDLDKQIEFCTNEANGTTNDKYCRIAINYLKHLKEILDKEVN